jgi:UDP-glucuronate 4-epimerase
VNYHEFEELNIMNILITGVAGFIGHCWASHLLNKHKKYKIIGIDNFDNYYSVKYKKNRLNNLKKYKNFYFSKVDIGNKSKLSKFFKKYKFTQVYHFAAQAGVRYSLVNPKKYIDVNIHGFINICENLVKNKIKKFIYASSSSVYGDTKVFPVSEDLKKNPKNIYGYSKLINEIIAEYYSQNFKINSIGLRFFTVFGSWGRPDMLIIKLLNANKKNKNFYLNNSGDHYRDFTSINDVVSILEKLSKKNFLKHNVFNICANRPVYIKTLIRMIKKYKGNLKIQNIPKNKADVYKTHGNNSKIVKYLKLKKILKLEDELKKTIEWFNTQEVI